jgi:hypothetical protein
MQDPATVRKRYPEFSKCSPIDDVKESPGFDARVLLNVMGAIGVCGGLPRVMPRRKWNWHHVDAGDGRIFPATGRRISRHHGAAPDPENGAGYRQEVQAADSHPVTR